MSATESLVVHFACAPEPGPLSADVFAYESKPMPTLRSGEILLRSLYLSIDAGSRTQLDYVLKAVLGKVLGSSGAVVEVGASLDPADWQVGDLLVAAQNDWVHTLSRTPEILGPRLHGDDGG